MGEKHSIKYRDHSHSAQSAPEPSTYLFYEHIRQLRVSQPGYHTLGDLIESRGGGLYLVEWTCR